ARRKRIKEEQAAKAYNSKILICYDDDDDYSAITPSEPVDSLGMGDEHLNTVSATESDEFIKSCVENLAPNPKSMLNRDSSIISSSSKIDSLLDEFADFPKKIYSNPFFDEEIMPMEIDQHSLDAEFDLIESMPNHDSSIIISSKIDSLFDEFDGELTLLKLIPPGIDETDCHPEKELRFAKRLLYDNSSPHPPEEIVSNNSNADIKSFSPSPILNEDKIIPMESLRTHDSYLPISSKIDSLLEFAGELTLLKSIPPGIDETDCDFEEDIHLIEKLLYDNSSLR
nr:hypothetical protein [Tanacetum cinerariifolium]